MRDLKKKEIKIGIVFICFVIVGVMTKKVINTKSKVDVVKLKTDVVCSASILLKTYQLDKIKANALCFEKIIEVKGVVLEAFSEKDKGIVVLDGKTPMSSIVCHLSKEEVSKTEKINRGDQVVIKGLCTGYSMDVILMESVIINN